MIKLLTEFLWIIATFMIFSCGIYFAFKLKFVHLRFGKMFRAMREENSGKISHFQSLMIALAGRIGVGSLAGIALAVYIGGPGVIFWIWLTSFLCASNAFVESYLGVIFRKKEGDIYQGGPFYYISEGLRNKRLGIFYALIFLVSYIGGFLTVQINTMTKSINSLVPISPLFIGIIICILAGTTIIGGVKKIANVTGKLIPIVTIFYLAMGTFIILSNWSFVPQVFSDIISSALNFKAFGAGVLVTMLLGMQKGIFSSELGLGSGAVAASLSSGETPASNGYVQTLGIHIENLLIATMTVLVICLSNYQSLEIADANGIELTLHAFSYHFGSIGNLFIVITISLFGLSTILSGYYYGESALKFLKKTKQIDIYLLKILTLGLLVIGSVISSNLLWKAVDIMVALIAIINIYALFKLRKAVKIYF